MTRQSDPLRADGGMTPDRLNFATGMLLAEDDFRAEQAYHRGRLARALAYLHGSGTLAGLRVGYRRAEAAEGGAAAVAEEIVVEPGLAIDRLGRVIELRAAHCIRLDRWYAEPQRADALRLALHGPPYDGVVVDLFASFLACPHGKTQVFSSGGAEALSAVTAARLRDSAELVLVPRQEGDPPLPVAGWPTPADIADPAARRRALQDRIMGAWPREHPDGTVNPEPPAEYAPGQDPTAVFLARVVIPAGEGEPPARRTDGDGVVQPEIDNYGRLFVVTPRALAAHLGLNLWEEP